MWSLAVLPSSSTRMIVATLPAPGNHCDPLNDAYPLPLQRFHLLWVVRQQSYTAFVPESEISHDGSSNLVAPFVRTMAQEKVGGDGVVSEVLQVISADLLEEPDTAAFLSEIDDCTASRDGDRGR